MYAIKNTVHRISNKGLREIMSKVTARCNHYSFKSLDLRIDEREPEVEVMFSSHLSQHFPTFSLPEYT